MAIGSLTNQNIFIAQSYRLSVRLPIRMSEMTDIEIPVKIGTAGRAQIPQEIRERLKIEEGDYLLIKIEKIIKGNQEEKQEAI